MKKIIAVFALVIVFCISGCGSLKNEFPDTAEGKLAMAMTNFVHEPLEEAIEQGADINYFSKEYRQRTNNGKYESNPLRIGMYHGIDHYMVGRMLEAGADPDLYDSDGYPVFFYSAWEDDTDLCQIFLDHGADISKRSKDKCTILDYYLQTKAPGGADLVNRKFVQLLLEQGVPVDKNTWKLAEKTGAYHIFDLLYHAPQNELDDFSQLQKAYLEGKIEEGNALLRQTLIPDQKDTYLAAVYGNRETIEILKVKKPGNFL